MVQLHYIKNNIKVDLKLVGYESVDYIPLSSFLKTSKET
jgi:hypothetical protein